MWRLFLSAVILCTALQLNEAERKTFCYMNETLACSNFNLSCNNQQFIQLHTVWYKAEMACDTNYCCCDYHIMYDILINNSIKAGLNILCEHKQHCDIADYLRNSTGKVTINFTCEEVSSEVVPPLVKLTTRSTSIPTNSTMADSISVTNFTEITSAPDTLTTVTFSSTTMTSMSNISTNSTAGIMTNEISTKQSSTGGNAPTFTTTNALSTTATSDGQGIDGFPTVLIIVVVVLLAVYAVVATVIICYKRKRLKKLQPSFIQRLVSKLKSPVPEDMTYTNSSAMEMDRRTRDDQTGVYCILGPSEDEVYTRLT